MSVLSPSHFCTIKIYRRFHGRSNDEDATSFVSLTCVAVPDGLRSATASTASVEVLLVDRGPFFCLRFFFRAPPPPPDFLPSLQRTKTNSARVSIIFRISGICHHFMVRLIESMCVSFLRTFLPLGWNFQKNVNGLCFFFKFLS